MAKLNSFAAEAALQGHTNPGLNEVNGSTTRVIVTGDGLDDMSIKITKASDPYWVGTLTAGSVAGSWYSDVTCTYSTTSNTAMASPMRFGDPADVSITVTVGRDLTNPDATLNTTAGVGIGTTHD